MCGSGNQCGGLTQGRLACQGGSAQGFDPTSRLRDGQTFAQGKLTLREE